MLTLSMYVGYILYVSGIHPNFTFLYLFQMTGLDVRTSHILEVACVVTDNDLKIVSDDLNVIVHQPNEILESMNDWCIKTHKKVSVHFKFY